MSCVTRLLDHIVRWLLGCCWHGNPRAIFKNKMDDASLEKLSISPGKLTPKFNKDITEYFVVVGSSVQELKVSPLTRDNNACYSISVSI